MSVLVDEKNDPTMEWLWSQPLGNQDHGAVPLENFEAQRHHKQLCFGRGNFADASQIFLAIAFPKAAARETVAYFNFAGAQIAHEPQ